MMHNNAHIVRVDPAAATTSRSRRRSVNDWYLDGGDGLPLGSMQLIGKVQGPMMKAARPLAAQAGPRPGRRRSVECLVMAEDLPTRDNRVTVERPGGIRTHPAPRRRAPIDRLRTRGSACCAPPATTLIAHAAFDISMNSHQCGTVLRGRPRPSVLDPWCRAHDLDNLWVVDGASSPPRRR